MMPSSNPREWVRKSHPHFAQGFARNAKRESGASENLGEGRKATREKRAQERGAQAANVVLRFHKTFEKIMLVKILQHGKINMKIISDNQGNSPGLLGIYTNGLLLGGLVTPQ